MCQSNGARGKARAPYHDSCAGFLREMKPPSGESAENCAVFLPTWQHGRGAKCSDGQPRFKFVQLAQEAPIKRLDHGPVQMLCVAKHIETNWRVTTFALE